MHAYVHPPICNEAFPSPPPPQQTLSMVSSIVLIINDIIIYRLGLSPYCMKVVALGLNVLFSTLWLGAFVIYLYEWSNVNDSTFRLGLTPSARATAATIITFSILACVFWVRVQ